MYISSAEPSRGRFLSDKKIVISETLSLFTEMSDMALNKIFKKENFNFSEKPNSKRFKIGN